MSNIFTPNGTTKGRAMSCCSLGVQTPAATGLFSAASDWAACCVITIRRQHELGALGLYGSVSGQPLDEKIQHRIHGQKSNAKADIKQHRKEGHVRQGNRIGTVGHLPCVP